MDTDNHDYIGDVNLEYGGLFINLDDWQYGYANCLQITDLDSGCGFTGAVMVSPITVIIEPDQIIAANKCCGGVFGRDSKSRKMSVVYNLASYGAYDPGNNPYEPANAIIQCDPNREYAPMEFDGWVADVGLTDKQDLYTFLLDNGFLSEF